MIEAEDGAETLVARPARISDLRRHQRVRVSLLGRYMLSDRREYPCLSVDMSPGGLRVTCAELGELGERIVLYLEQVGRIEGVVARLPASGGMAVRLSATPRKRDKIASQLTWLANREALGLSEGRTHERLVPTHPRVMIRFEGGREVAVRIIDISMSGVAIATDAKPPIGTSLMVGTTPGRVVRYFEGGIGAHFLLPLSADRFHEGIRL